MAHTPARRGSGAGDEGDDRLAHASHELRRVLLRAAADLADEDDGGGLCVLVEQLQRLALGGADDRVAAHADTGGLADTARGELGDGLVHQRAAAGDDADGAGGEDIARHDADATFAGGDDTGAVGADEPGASALQRPLHLHHVHGGDVLSDADGERDLGVGCLQDGVGGERGGHEDERAVRLRLARRVADGVEDGHALHGLATAAGGDAGHHLRPVLDAALGLEAAFASGDALDENARGLVDENAHFRRPFRFAFGLLVPPFM